jgi:hypothetical protein
MIDRAIDSWRVAGLRSVARSAHAEAGAHFGFALDLLKKLPPSEQRDARELDLRLNLAVPLVAVHGFGTLRVEECAVRAMELSNRLHGWPSRFAASRLAWNSCLMRQPVPKTVALARDLIELADADGSTAKLAVAHRALGYSLLVVGELHEADAVLARGSILADAIEDREFAVYGEHPSIICRMYGAQAKLMLGFPTASAELAEEAVTFARREENAHSLAWALGVAAHTSLLAHEAEATARFASEAIDISREHAMPQWLALGERCMGWAMHKLGQFDAGLNLQQQGLKRWTESAGMLHMSHCQLHIAESLLREGRAAAARTHLDAARTHCDSYGETYLLAEIDRLEALVLQCEQAAAKVIEDRLVRSLGTARQQGGRWHELRTATTFARFLRDNGERGRAVDTLAPVYGWFTEGFETQDMKQANALLEELN